MITCLILKYINIKIKIHFNLNNNIEKIIKYVYFFVFNKYIDYTKK